MDEYEVNLIVEQCSPSPTRKSSNTQSVSAYSFNQNMVKSCKNCKFSFRTEFKPNAVYCSKDCETSYTWFLKKSNSIPEATVCVPLVTLPEENGVIYPTIQHPKQDYYNKSLSPLYRNIGFNTAPTTANTTPCLPEDPEYTPRINSSPANSSPDDFSRNNSAELKSNEFSNPQFLPPPRRRNSQSQDKLISEKSRVITGLRSMFRGILL